MWRHQKTILVVFIVGLFIGTSIVPAFSSDSILNLSNTDLDGSKEVLDKTDDCDTNHPSKNNIKDSFQQVKDILKQSTDDASPSRFQRLRGRIQDTHFTHSFYRSKPTTIEGVTGQWDMVVPDDYSTIQAAVDDVSPQNGYRIFVRSGTYYENIVIDKDGIILKGENREQTIINGENKDNTIRLIGNYVNISGFTIQNSGKDYSGVFFEDSSGDVVDNNKIMSNTNGIMLVRSHGNIIRDNIILNNEKGCTLDFCLIGNTIKNNVFLENYIGVYVNATCRSNKFYQNTFKNNSQHAYSLTSQDSTKWNNDSIGNYWDDYNGSDDNGDGIGDTPYVIDPYENVDYYPLMKPVNDFLAPSITIIKPEEKYMYLFDEKICPFICTFVIGDISVEIQAWENESGIDHIEIYVNNIFMKNITTRPYVFLWDQLGCGKQILKIKAYDAMMNYSIKELILFKFG